MKARGSRFFSPFGAVVSLGDQIKRTWPREQIDIPLSESQEKKATSSKDGDKNDEGKKDDNVVDADFEEVKEEKKEEVKEETKEEDKEKSA